MSQLTRNMRSKKVVRGKTDQHLFGLCTSSPKTNMMLIVLIVKSPYEYVLTASFSLEELTRSLNIASKGKQMHPLRWDESSPPPLPPTPYDTDPSSFKIPHLSHVIWAHLHVTIPSHYPTTHTPKGLRYAACSFRTLPFYRLARTYFLNAQIVATLQANATSAVCAHTPPPPAPSPFLSAALHHDQRRGAVGLRVVRI